MRIFSIICQDSVELLERQREGVSASKFLGKDDLAKQVAINSRKITILKNVIQAQQSSTGSMLTSLSGGSVRGVEKNIMDIKKP